jgi:hypothetical protein
MQGQQDITDNTDNPAVIPKRKLRDAELVEMKILAREAKESLSAFYGGLQSFGITDRFKWPGDRCDDAGKLLDDVINFCSEELKKPEVKRKKGGANNAP